MEGHKIDLKTFFGLYMPITNALKLSESKYQASLRTWRFPSLDKFESYFVF